MNTVEIIIAILGSLGGLELVKWLFNRKANSRIAESEADSAEFHTLQEAMLFLQGQVKEKEERFAEQTERLRQLQTDYFNERELRFSAELELCQKRCNVKGCSKREPQNGY